MKKPLTIKIDEEEWTVTGEKEMGEYQVICNDCKQEYADLDTRGQLKFYCSECPQIRFYQ
jgi:hypothetical protein